MIGWSKKIPMRVQPEGLMAHRSPEWNTGCFFSDQNEIPASGIALCRKIKRKLDLPGSKVVWHSLAYTEKQLKEKWECAVSRKSHIWVSCSQISRRCILIAKGHSTLYISLLNKSTYPVYSVYAAMGSLWLGEEIGIQSFQENRSICFCIVVCNGLVKTNLYLECCFYQ